MFSQILAILLISLRSLWMHRLRSGLTTLGIVFGVSSVISMLAIGEGASQQAQAQIAHLGSTNIILKTIKSAYPVRRNLFNSIIEEKKFVEKKLTVEKYDNVVIRNRESMHYYEIFKKLFGSPVDDNAENACPYCKHEVKNSKFCRMCGAFPV